MFSHKLWMNAIGRIKFRFADRLRLKPARAVIPRRAGILRGAGKVWETIRNQPMRRPTKQFAEARRTLKEVIAHADSRRLAPYYVAQIYAR